MLTLSGIGRWALISLVSVFAVLNAPALSNLVLCLGQDGHFELEYSIDGKCGASHRSGSEAAFNGTGNEGHCGTCTDLSVGACEDARRPAPAALPIPQAVCLPASAVRTLPHLERISPHLLSLPPPPDRPHLAHLRAVRLLV